MQITEELEIVMSNIELHFELASVLSCADTFIHCSQTLTISAYPRQPRGHGALRNEREGRVGTLGIEQAGKNTAATE